MILYNKFSPYFCHWINSIALSTRACWIPTMWLLCMRLSISADVIVNIILLFLKCYEALSRNLLDMPARSQTQSAGIEDISVWRTTDIGGGKAIDVTATIAICQWMNNAFTNQSEFSPLSHVTISSKRSFLNWSDLQGEGFIAALKPN